MLLLIFDYGLMIYNISTEAKTLLPIKYDGSDKKTYIVLNEKNELIYVEQRSYKDIYKIVRKVKLDSLLGYKRNGEEKKLNEDKAK